MYEKIYPQIFLHQVTNPLKVFMRELNLQNVRVLINCSYNPCKAKIDNLEVFLNSFLGKICKKCEKKLILGDFKVKIDDPKMQTFCEVFHLKS